MASKGRGPDSMLVHMSPSEVAGLHALALKHGGSLTINPDTGLPEAGFLDKLLPTIIGAGISYFSGGAIDPMTAAAMVGGAETVRTGSLERGLMAGMGAYGGAGLTAGFTGAGTGALSAEVGGAALSQAGLTGEAALTAQADQIASQAISDKLASATPWEKLSEGAKAVTQSPSTMGSFAKDNWKYLAGVASPIVADMMVPTTTKQPDIQSNDTINQFIYGPTGYRRLNPVPAAGYGTPERRPFANGGIVALNSGGVPGYAGVGTSLIKEADLKNIYANLGGETAFNKIATNYLDSGGNDAGLASIMSKYATAPAAPVAAAAPVVTAAAPAVTTAAAPAALTADQKAAMALMFKSSTGGVDQAAMDALGGSAAVRKLATSAGFDDSDTGLYNYASKTPGAIDFTSDAGKKLIMNNYTQSYFNDIASKIKTPAEQALELMYRSTTTGAPTGAFNALGGTAAVRKLAESAGFDATPEWQAEYEKKMGYPVVSRMSTAATAAADKAASDKAAAATTGIAALDRVDAGADTRLDYTGDGTSTVKPVAVTSSGTYKTVAGDTSTAPAIGTAVGQGTYQGTGTTASTGTQGPIVDFTGKTAFTSNPLTLAKQQIADQSAAKTAADKTKLDLYSQWGASNPTATKMDHVNFIDKIGLPPETAAQLLNISPDQARDAYYDTKFNQQTGDSMAAYKYLMGQGAYPTKSGVGEIARPYAEATLGLPANTNRQYIYDQATGKYTRNPDYVAEYKDPSGSTNYLMSQKEIFDYFKKNAGQDDATTYAWALANNLTPKEISEATGVPISKIAPKWRAAAANKVATEVKNEDGTINKEATEKAIADKAAADKAAADAAADKAVKDSWDEAAYLAANPDVAAELSTGKSVSGKPVKFTSGYEHYTMYGKDSGRQATTKKAAGGGMMGYAMGGYAVGGGLGSLGSYSDGGRLLRGPGDGVSDSIPATIGAKQQPARLADGEFVVPARIVSELGNGSTEAGAKKLYAMMDRVQRARGKTTGKNKVAANSRADKYLPA
jgi:hypothetical protein